MHGMEAAEKAAQEALARAQNATSTGSGTGGTDVIQDDSWENLLVASSVWMILLANAAIVCLYIAFCKKQEAAASAAHEPMRGAKIAPTRASLIAALEAKHSYTAPTIAGPPKDCVLCLDDILPGQSVLRLPCSPQPHECEH